MGLAASQVRLLSLTSRQHSLENQAQRLQNCKMQLANDSDKVYRTYLNALNDTALKTRQTNNETGDSCWINGSINNLMRYNTSASTTGNVFYVQDMETGKLYVPEEIGKNYDSVTSARDFAGKFGITYTEVDHNEDVKINYNKALEKGWDKIMTEASLNEYYTARAKDEQISAMTSLALSFVPTKDKDGLYQTYYGQDSMASNFINQAKVIMGSTDYTTIYTAQERQIIESAVNMTNTVDNNMYRQDSETKDSDTLITTKTTYYINNMNASVNGKEYVSHDGDKFNLNEKYEMMLNGGTAKYKATQKTEMKTMYNSITTNEADVEDTFDLYDSTTQSMLTSYGAKNYGEALTNIFKRVQKESTYVKNFLNNKGLTQQDVNNYLEFLNLQTNMNAYTPDIEFVPSDKVLGPYYEQVYNAISSAGGWIGASDERAKNDTWVQNMIKNAQVILTTWDDENGMLSKTSASLNTNIKEVTDNSKTEQASQDYEAAMDKINNKDTTYDTVLSTLETERNSIKTEIDALNNVIKNNVDKNFKIMS